MTLKSNKVLCSNLEELIKKILISFCEVNVQYQEKLELLGSVHIRADGEDIFGILLNEKSKKKKANADTQCAGEIGGSTNSSLQSQLNCEQSSTQTIENSIDYSSTEVIDLSDPEDTAMTPSKEEVGYSPNNQLDTMESTAKIPQDTVNEVKYQPQETLDQLTHLSPSHDNGSSECKSSFGCQPLTFGQNLTHSNISCHQSVSGSSEDTIPTQNVSNNPDTLYVSMDHNEKSTLPVNEILVSEAGTVNSTNVSLSENFMPDGPFNAENKLCVFCQKSFTSNLLLKLHLQRWHSQKSPSIPSFNKALSCCKCHIIFDTFEQFSKHVCCQKSNESFASKFQLQQTNVGEPGDSANDKAESPIKDSAHLCTQCGSLLATRDGLKCHINSRHSRNRVWTCDLCTNRTFFSRQALHNHKRHTHKFKGNIQSMQT